MVRSFLRFVVQLCLLCTALLLCAVSSASAQASNPFFTPSTFGGSGQALSADVNGDGKPDLVFFDGTVLLGKGDGTFTTGKSWNPPQGLTASQFAIADFNGDGKPDILVVGPLNQLSVLLGNGDGTFRSAVTTSIIAPATTFVMGDLNGDGKPDVLAQVGSAFFSYLGKGDGTFAAGVMSNATSASIFDTLVDLNGDGKADLFIYNQAVLQLGNGDGTFQAASQLPFDIQQISGLLGDFDGDGKLDIMGSNGSSANLEIQILFGNGDGTFRAGSVQPFMATATSDLTVADLNGDGKADLVGWTGSAVQVLIGKGDGTFSPEKFYNVSNSGSGSIVVADFNNDGKQDLAAFNAMLLGNGDGTLQGDEAVPGIAGNGITGDFNGDGHPDLALITYGSIYNTVNLNIWLNDGKADLTLAHTYPIPIPSPAADSAGLVAISAAADLNGDGKTDLFGILWDGSGLSVIVLLGNGDGSFGAPIATLLSDVSWHGGGASVVLGDLNGDKNPDAVLNVMGRIGYSGFFVLLGNGDGTFGAPSSPYVSQSQPGLTAGDFNNDKKLDVIIETSNGLGVLLGNGDGTFQPTTFVQTNNFCCGNLLSADFNGDGNLDLMIAAASGYQILSGKGDGTFTVIPTITDSLGAFSGTQVADFNGDGHLDVFGQFVTQSGSPLGLILRNGDGTFGNQFTYSVSGAPLVADFNGDGKLDVALVGTNQLVWLFNVAPAVAPPPPPPPDFSVGSEPGVGTATVTAGSTATYPIALTGSGGFAGAVALTCSVAPAGPACSVSPSSVALSGNTTVTATVSVMTTARTGFLPTSVPGDQDSSRRIFWIFGAFLAAVAFTLFTSRQLRPRFSWSFATACAAILLLSVSLISGCGGGSTSSTGSGGSSATGTTAGNYTVTVSAQSGSVNHKMQLTLTVQ
jgi:hypothetical protein